MAKARQGTTDDVARNGANSARPVLRLASAATAACFLIAGCGAASGSPDGGQSNSVTSNADSDKVLVASGFGQKDRYIWAAALVRNTGESVGQTVRVHFTVLDSAGRKLAVGSESGWFAVPQQQLAIGHSFQLRRGTKAASVEATVSVQDTGAFGGQPRPAIPVDRVVVKPDGTGNYLAYLKVTNPTSDPLQDPTIGVICYDTKNRVSGGGIAEPPLLPASSSIVANASVIANGADPRCDAYASYRY